jgi:hypothetical protein
LFRGMLSKVCLIVTFQEIHRFLVFCINTTHALAGGIFYAR